MANAAQHADIVGTVVPPPATALHRLDFAESAFPESQHVLRDLELGRHFADGAERVRRFVQNHVALSSRPWSELGRSVLAVSIDSVLEYGRGFKHHHPPRRNRHFFASLGVTSNALTLLAHDERTKRRQLYRLTALKAVGDFLQYQFHKRRRFRAG